MFDRLYFPQHLKCNKHQEFSFPFDGCVSRADSNEIIFVFTRRVLRLRFFAAAALLVACRLHAHCTMHTERKWTKWSYKYGDHKLKTTSVQTSSRFNECGLRCWGWCVVQVNSCEKLQTHALTHKHSHERLNCANTNKQTDRHSTRYFVWVSCVIFLFGGANWTWFVQLLSILVVSDDDIKHAKL